MLASCATLRSRPTASEGRLTGRPSYIVVGKLFPAARLTPARRASDGKSRRNPRSRFGLVCGRVQVGSGHRLHRQDPHAGGVVVHVVAPQQLGQARVQCRCVGRFGIAARAGPRRWADCSNPLGFRVWRRRSDRSRCRGPRCERNQHSATPGGIPRLGSRLQYSPRRRKYPEDLPDLSRLRPPSGNSRTKRPTDSRGKVSLPNASV